MHNTMTSKSLIQYISTYHKSTIHCIFSHQHPRTIQTHKASGFRKHISRINAVNVPGMAKLVLRLLMDWHVLMRDKMQSIFLGLMRIDKKADFSLVLCEHNKKV